MEFAKENIEGLDIKPLYSDMEFEEIVKALKESEDKVEYYKLKTEFLANISHEFKTPLNILMGAMQLIEMYSLNGSIKDPDKKLENYMKTMKQNSLRLLKLINNIIEVTKIDASGIDIELHNYDIVAIVRSVVQSVAVYGNLKSINVNFYSEIEERIIACDADKIERILLNLLSNALKFTNENGNIDVSVTNSNGKVFISVEDSGIGIPEDKKKMIFERFRQVDKTFTRNREGSGIGLSIVKALVEMHNGNIIVESQYNKGSRFIVELPEVILNEKSHASLYLKYENRIIERVKVELSDIE